MSVRYLAYALACVGASLVLYGFVAHAMHKPLNCPCFAISDECWK